MPMLQNSPDPKHDLAMHEARLREEAEHTGEVEKSASREGVARRWAFGIVFGLLMVAAYLLLRS